MRGFFALHVAVIFVSPSNIDMGLPGFLNCISPILSPFSLSTVTYLPPIAIVYPMVYSPVFICGILVPCPSTTKVVLYISWGGSESGGLLLILGLPLAGAMDGGLMDGGFGLIDAGLMDGGFEVIPITCMVYAAIY
jgi:hypothetical protein